ncbi:uncharacterized protein [Typha angustifolia]|uniref:uncharacterized protein n=1 Tax=Typha angustifolia TaxID=59011 RepID=UPI003C2D9C20
MTTHALPSPLLPTTTIRSLFLSSNPTQDIAFPTSTYCTQLSPVALSSPTARRRQAIPSANAEIVALHNSGSSSSRRTANLFAERRESIKLPEQQGRALPISDFLRHPSGVESLLNTRALQSFEYLEANTYRCTLHKIQFLKFEVAPVLDLRVTQTDEYCTVEMLSCRFEGSETVEKQNHLFSAFMRNHITWEANGYEPTVHVDVNLKVTLEVYTKPFSLLPISAVEKPGNLLMQGLLDRLVPLLVEQLLRDYNSWLEEQFEVPT